MNKRLKILTIIFILLLSLITSSCGSSNNDEDVYKRQDNISYVYLLIIAHSFLHKKYREQVGKQGNNFCNIRAVSYTHLDVYKRQAISL